MFLADNFLTIFGSLQWNLIYNILLLLTLLAALALALGHWRRFGQPDARQLWIGCSVIFLTRVAPLVLALTPAFDYRMPVFLPPLERALDTIALAVLSWMFLAPAGAAWSVPFLGLNVVLAGLADVALTRFWMQDLAALPTLSYGASWQRYVWGGWQITLCLFSLVMALRRRRYAGQTGFLAPIFVILLLGQALEMIVPITPALFPIWERVSVLIGAMLMSVVIYQAALAELRQPSNAPLPALPQAGTPTETLLALVSDEPGAAGKPDVSDVAQAVLAARAEDRHSDALAGRLARLIARALDAEQAAIGLLEGSQEDRMHLTAIFNPHRRGRGEIVSFPLDEQLAIRRALRRRETVQANGAEDIIQIKFLYALMGSEETGPVLIQPLIYRDRPVGALIAGNGAAKRPFSPAAVRLIPFLAEAVAATMVAPRAAQQAEEKLRQTQQTTAEREADYNRRLDIIATDLQHERENTRLFAQRMADLERAAQQKQAEAERQMRRQAQLEEDVRRKQDENAALNKKLDSLTLAKVVLEDEVQGFRDQVRNLEHLLAEQK